MMPIATPLSDLSMSFTRISMLYHSKDDLPVKMSALALLQMFLAPKSHTALFGSLREGYIAVVARKCLGIWY
jgi:hypothetical protein